MINLIFACDPNGCIGIDGKLPWSIPEDLKRFRDLTWGHTVLMGRKTWESLPDKNKPLPSRKNIIVSNTLKDPGPEIEGQAYVVNSIEEGLRDYKDFFSQNTQLFVIGGADLFSHFIKNKLVDRIYMTLVHKRFDGDRYIRPINLEYWEISDWTKKNLLVNKTEQIDCSFITLDKFKKPIPVFHQWYAI